PSVAEAEDRTARRPADDHQHRGDEGQRMPRTLGRVAGEAGKQRGSVLLILGLIFPPVAHWGACKVHNGAVLRLPQGTTPISRGSFVSPRSWARRLPACPRR